tara:strand:+ start:223 stop:558 length:336 start_codon:yes stop_codon:yes gene_type:complete
MGFSYKKNIGKGYQMKHGNSAFKMVTPTVVDNAGLFYKLKEGIPNVLSATGSILGGFGVGQLLKTGAKKVAQIGIRKAAPIIGRKVAEKVGQKGATSAGQAIQNFINPFNT